MNTRQKDIERNIEFITNNKLLLIWETLSYGMDRKFGINETWRKGQIKQRNYSQGALAQWGFRLHDEHSLCRTCRKWKAKSAKNRANMFG